MFIFNLLKPGLQGVGGNARVHLILLIVLSRFGIRDAALNYHRNC